MNIGDKVMTSVSVCGGRVPIQLGIITARINDQLVEVDIGSLHGCSPWKHIEQESHLILVDAQDIN